MLNSFDHSMYFEEIIMVTVLRIFFEDILSLSPSLSFLVEFTYVFLYFNFMSGTYL